MPPKSEDSQRPSLLQSQQSPPAQIDEVRRSGRGSTGHARSKQSPPYRIIGAGLLVVIGAFVGQWILSSTPSSIITRNPSAFQATELLRTQSQRIMQEPGPATMVLVPAGEFVMGAHQEYEMAD